MVHSKKKKSAAKQNASPAAESRLAPMATYDRGALSSGTDDTDRAFGRIADEVEDYAIIVLDLTGSVMTWNKGAEKIKGYSAAKIIGKNFRMFFTQEDKDNDLPAKLLDEASKNGRVSFEGWSVRKDGTRFWGNCTITALHNEDGTTRGYLKINRDFTDKKIADDTYSNFVEELKMKNEALAKSEERYHKMVSEVQDYAIILLDKDGKVLDWNKGAEKVKGYTPGEIVGKSFRLFYPKEEKEDRLPEKLLAEAVKKGSTTHEGWRIRKDGRRFWGNVTITALHGADGEIIGFSKVTRDLTEKKIAEDKVSNVLEELRQANDRLKQSEERYSKMIEEVQDYAIILLDQDGYIQNWNTGAEFIKGYKSRDIIGKNFRIFYTKEDQENRLPESLLKQAVQNGKAHHEGWRVRKDGAIFWGNVVITALHSADGNVIGFSKVTRDLTEKKKADDALRTSAAQIDLKNKTLQKLNEELSSFTHVASHDMKEPLRKIQTFASRIEEMGFPPEKSREYIEKIKNSAARMQNLIDDLLAYSQVSNDSSNFEKVNLGDVLEAVKSDLEVAIHEKQTVIESPRLPVVYGIPYQLHQLFLNLLSNSIKFSRPGVAPHIVVTAELIKGPDIPGYSEGGHNRCHHIVVRDNGIGFTHHNTDKIFQPFERLHAQTAFSGTGIGLAIVKKIIETHNGIISAEGQPGVGATFHIYLPVTQK